MSELKRVTPRVSDAPAQAAVVPTSRNGQEPLEKLHAQLCRDGRNRTHHLHPPERQQVRVEFNGEVLAESTRAIALEETGLPTRYYLPREDVRMDLLTPTDTSSHCPFKGDASYYSTPERRRRVLGL